VPRLSRRLPPHGEPNALSRRLGALRAAAVEYTDLTLSNPTQASIAYPEDLLRSLSDARVLTYEPSPLGMRAAREAVAADGQRRGASIDPARVVLSASTSEAYSWLFKLLCNAGDTVLIPRPSYPLFEHLTSLELVETCAYELEYHGRWSVDFASVEAAPANTRAILAVSPNNPTGSYLAAHEIERLTTICARRGWALIVDEVFADYSLETSAPVTDVAVRSPVLTFTLGGASKSLGLPQIKLAWMVVGGPDAECVDALAGLEIVADTFLSVSTPVQIAAPALLRDAAPVRQAIHDRVTANLRAVRALARECPACDVLAAEGGWSVVIRVPSTRTEEQLVLDLLDRERVLVHPGYFFDFATESFIVVSLLPRPDILEDAFARVLRFVNC
jgi:alanine-synthesizing transaminase